MSDQADVAVPQRSDDDVLPLKLKVDLTGGPEPEVRASAEYVRSDLKYGLDDLLHAARERGLLYHLAIDKLQGGDWRVEIALETDDGVQLDAQGKDPAIRKAIEACVEMVTEP